MPKNAKSPAARTAQGAAAPVPSTLKRSPKKAQATYKETLASAEKEYSGDEQRAHRVAWGAVKHSFEKTGDHWTPKSAAGPSDPRSARGGPGTDGKSYGGVNLAHSKAELLEIARERGIPVAARETKAQIAEKLQGDNTRATRQAREKGSSSSSRSSRSRTVNKK